MSQIHAEMDTAVSGSIGHRAHQIISILAIGATSHGQNVTGEIANSQDCSGKVIGYGPLILVLESRSGRKDAAMADSRIEAEITYCVP